MNERATTFIDRVTAEVARNGSSTVHEPNQGIRKFHDMATWASYDSEEGPSSETVVYAATDLLTSEGMDRRLVNISFNLLERKDPVIAAKVKRGFETGVILLNLASRSTRNR